jgi:MFS family permease
MAHAEQQQGSAGAQWPTSCTSLLSFQKDQMLGHRFPRFRGNETLWTISSLYFFTFFAMACQGRFIALFLGDFGVQSHAVGIILATGTTVSLFATPFFAAACDIYKDRRTVLISCVCGSALSVTLYAVPWAAPEFFKDPMMVMTWLLLVRGTYSFFWAPVNTILDALAIVTLTG